jgi:CAAX prenyl protease-like protein
MLHPFVPAISADPSTLIIGGQNFRVQISAACSGYEGLQSVDWQSVSWIAILLSSVVFGFLHGERWLAGTIAGLIYAVAWLRRGSMGDATAAHATTNALVAGWVLMGGHWQLW